MPQPHISSILIQRPNHHTHSPSLGSFHNPNSLGPAGLAEQVQKYLLLHICFMNFHPPSNNRTHVDCPSRHLNGFLSSTSFCNFVQGSPPVSYQLSETQNMIAVSDNLTSTEPRPYHLQLLALTFGSPPTQQHLTLLWIHHLLRY